MPLTSAFKAGRDAYNQGLSFDACPHPIDSAEAVQWTDGYLRGMAG